MFSHLGSISFRESFGLILRFTNWNVFGGEEHMLVSEAAGFTTMSGGGGCGCACPASQQLISNLNLVHSRPERLAAQLTPEAANFLSLVSNC